MHIIILMVVVILLVVVGVIVYLHYQSKQPPPLPQFDYVPGLMVMSQGPDGQIDFYLDEVSNDYSRMQEIGAFGRIYFRGQSVVRISFRSLLAMESYLNSQAGFASFPISRPVTDEDKQGFLTSVVGNFN